ncbi:MAG: ribonuclease III [Deltaproteobacteria bacterium]|nr:ribonuclease III [Deltaproteobacteria bacterium]
MHDEGEQLAALSAALGHEFRDLGLLRDAVTHKSLAHERPRLAPRDNERLEFLGDSIVGLIASAVLYEHFPDAPEGELTRRRADLVCEAGLTAIARALRLGAALRLGRGEESSGGRNKSRLLSSAVEACLAAVYLDGGLEAAMTVGRHLLSPHLDDERPGASDYKSRVQEMVQGQARPTPVYRVVATEGPDHDRRFTVDIIVGDETLGRGVGRSKTEAEQAAAAEAIEHLVDGEAAP